MKYMGWNHDDLMGLPMNYYMALIEIIKEEAERIEEARSGDEGGI